MHHWKQSTTAATAHRLCASVASQSLSLRVSRASLRKVTSRVLFRRGENWWPQKLVTTQYKLPISVFIYVPKRHIIGCKPQLYHSQCSLDFKHIAGRSCSYICNCCWLSRCLQRVRKPPQLKWLYRSATLCLACLQMCVNVLEAVCLGCELR